MPTHGDIENAAWLSAAENFLLGSPPSLTFAPRTRDPSAPPALTIAEAKALAVSAPIPPPRRKILEGLILLWHDHWEAAHAVAQSHEGQSDHDYLHAIGHRREGDYPNADYWFGSAGKHPASAALASAAATALPEGHPLRPLLLPGGRWASKAFTAEVRRAATGDSPHTEDLSVLQALEMRLFAGWLLAG